MEKYTPEENEEENDWQEEESNDWSPTMEAYKAELAEFEEKLDGLPEEIADEIRFSRDYFIEKISDNTGVKNAVAEQEVANAKEFLALLMKSPKEFFEKRLENVEAEVAESLASGEEPPAPLITIAEHLSDILEAFKKSSGKSW